MNTKVQNYTAEQTAEVVAQYQAGTSTEAIAASMGKSVRSIVAKLSKEGVYVAKARATKADVTTKEDLVRQLAVAAGVAFDDLVSLEKATKGALVALVEAFAQDFDTQ